jgi:hypothetical protein
VNHYRRYIFHLEYQDIYIYVYICIYTYIYIYMAYPSSFTLTGIDAEFINVYALYMWKSTVHIITFRIILSGIPWTLAVLSSSFAPTVQFPSKHLNPRDLHMYVIWWPFYRFKKFRCGALGKVMNIYKSLIVTFKVINVFPV